MNLKEWKEHERLYLSEMSELFEISSKRISEWMNGGRPSVSMAVRISKITGGQVTIHELLFNDVSGFSDMEIDIIESQDPARMKGLLDLAKKELELWHKSNHVDIKMSDFLREYKHTH